MSSVAIAVLAVAAYLLVVALIWWRNGVRYDALAREPRRASCAGSSCRWGSGRCCSPWSPRCSAGGGRRSPRARARARPGRSSCRRCSPWRPSWASPRSTGARPRRATCCRRWRVGCLFVGFAEELATRGLVLVGARESGWSELAAALLSMVVFSLVHAMNGLFGQSWKQTGAQLGLTLVAGAAFYVTRMTTGSLVVAMLLHAAVGLRPARHQGDRARAAPRPGRRGRGRLPDRHRVACGSSRRADGDPPASLAPAAPPPARSSADRPPPGSGQGTPGWWSIHSMSPLRVDRRSALKGLAAGTAALAVPRLFDPVAAAAPASKGIFGYGVASGDPTGTLRRAVDPRHPAEPARRAGGDPRQRPGQAARGALGGGARRGLPPRGGPRQGAHVGRQRPHRQGRRPWAEAVHPLPLPVREPRRAEPGGAHPHGARRARRGARPALRPGQLQQLHRWLLHGLPGDRRARRPRPRAARGRLHLRVRQRRRPLRPGRARRRARRHARHRDHRPRGLPAAARPAQGRPRRAGRPPRPAVDHDLRRPRGGQQRLGERCREPPGRRGRLPRPAGAGDAGLPRVDAVPDARPVGAAPGDALLQAVHLRRPGRPVDPRDPAEPQPAGDRPGRAVRRVRAGRASSRTSTRRSPRRCATCPRRSS